MLDELFSSQEPAAPESKMNRAPFFLLYWNVLVIASCGLVYELLAGTLASYVLGDSVTQFSLVIGVYLFALGVGAWLSRFLRGSLARAFIEVELGVALVGGFSAPLLFLAFAYGAWFQGVLFTLVFAVGTLVGLELPLLMRLLKSHVDFDDLVSRVLAFDYLGALAASLLFPLFLVPQLGLVRTSLAFGLLNAAVGLGGTYMLGPLWPRPPRGLQARAVLVIGLLVAGLIKAETLTHVAEERQFTNPIVHARSSPYQRIVVTQGSADFQLYLNGNLQFHSADEYRYHEALVHPALSLAGTAKHVLVLGGGDGLALREVLRWPGIERVTLVDIDPAMTDLAATFPLLAELNAGAMRDPRVEIVHDDAFVWLARRTPAEPLLDAAIVDFPDPSTFALGKLYTTRFYRLLRGALAPGAPVAVQCTSPLAAPHSYWCILATLRSAGFEPRPYQAAVPSFGVWGFALARSEPFTPPVELPPEISSQLRFLNTAALRGLFELPPDMAPRAVEVNRLDNQALVRYYEEEWNRWK